MIEIKLEYGDTLRHYPDGKINFLAYQVGHYIDLPQYAPQRSEPIRQGGLGIGKIIGYKSLGQIRLPEPKLVFHVTGFGTTQADAVKMSNAEKV